ncbi:hypothetical protein SAMN06265379_11318 [Saccharicrinis carchari]|uniref:Uncharacterized protein n=1 Tax=Saccharicrinis carchari TaxID=1168039 RepID=A0A521F1W3_SACCC|nr:hypothetical protein [Saccharicrinis carchari]SMO90097.1 hypothetical protein SAMN06265379_11318 [Saccharicrinis carchari]
MTFKKASHLLIIVSFVMFYSNAMATYTLYSKQSDEQLMSINRDSLLIIESRTLSRAYQFDGAIDILEQVVKRDSFNRDAFTELERLYFKTSQHCAAIHLHNYLILNKVDSAYYAIRKALSLRKIGQYQKSLDIFMGAFATDSSNSFISTQIGDLYKALEIPERALVYYNKTCQIKPSSTVMIKALDLYLKINQKDEALRFFNRYYKTEFASNQILLRLYGKTLYVNGKIELARKTFSRLYAAGDSSLVTCKFLGTCLWKQEDYGNAIPVLENFIQLDTTDYQVYYMLGTCHLKYKFGYKPTLGVDFLEKAIALMQPDGKTLNRIYNELALHYQYHQNYEKELEIYLIMKENEPDSRHVDYKMATLYDYGFNDKKEALQRYQNLLTLYKADSTSKTDRWAIIKFLESRIQELTEDNFW